MDVVALLVFAAAAVLALGLYLRIWSKRCETAQARASVECRRRLPGWVRSAEVLLVWLMAVVITPVILVLLHVAFLLANGGEDASGVSLGIILVCSVTAGFALAFLTGNALAWLIGPIRRANQAVFAGVPQTSYRAAFLGALKINAVVLPGSAILAVLAVLHPWSH